MLAWRDWRRKSPSVPEEGALDYKHFIGNKGSFREQ